MENAVLSVLGYILIPNNHWNPRTQRTYQNDPLEFGGYVGLTGADEFHAVTQVSYCLAVQLACDFVGREASKQVNDQLKSLITHDQLLGRPTGHAPFTCERLSIVRRIACNEPISLKRATDRGGAAAQHSGYFALTEIVVLPDLNGSAFFDAEFCIGHGGTVPKGEVLHSVFVAAVYDFPTRYRGCITFPREWDRVHDRLLINHSTKPEFMTSRAIIGRSHR